MKCTQCRADLEGGAKFCTLCGAPVPEGVVPEDPKQFSVQEVLNTSKAFTVNTANKIKPACQSLWGKICGLVKKGDEAITEKLGDKKMYAYAGVIGLVGIIIIVSAIIGLIPNDNGFLTYDTVGTVDAFDDKVYILRGDKMTELKTGAENVSDQATSIDGKVTVFKDYENILYAVKGKKTIELAEDVASFRLSLYGDYVVYAVQDGTSVLHYHCKVSNGKSVEIFESELDGMLTSYAISPDGKSVAYIATDGLDADLYYFNGKKSEKLGECLGSVIGLSDGGKYIYATDVNDEGKVYLYAFDKKGKDTKIDSCNSFSFALNLDATEIMFMNNGKTYVSVKAKEPIKVASNDLELILPSGVNEPYECSELGNFYPVETLFNHVYTSDSAAYFVSRKENKNIKLVKGSYFTLDNSAKYLYYMDKNDVMVLEIAKGEKAEDKAKLIAEDAYFYLVTSDRKIVYYADEDLELYAVNGKKGGKSKKISSDELGDAPVLDANDVVYYECDGDMYAAKGKKSGKKILSDFEGCESLYGYVILSDEDTLYIARGTKSPKKLMSLD